MIRSAGAAHCKAVTTPGGPEPTLPGGEAGSGHIAPPKPLPKRGDRIGHFVVQRKLGSGAMGVVFLAVDQELDRRVAIKLLTTSLSGPVAQARLVREARSGARLQHPNVVAVHQVGTHDDQVYLVMEYVDGGTLRQWLGEARAWKDVLEVFRQAGAGLAAAHEAGMVHRDFKPDNVLIDTTGRVRVSDFGLVDAGVETSEPNSTISDSFAGERLTQTGAVMGTPAYMSPEQMQTADVDARSDQFALCVTLYEALWNKSPFPADTLATLVAARLEGADEPPRSAVPTRVRDAVMRGLSYEPASRFPNIPALLRELEPRSSSRATAAIVAAGLVAAAAGVAIATREPLAQPPCAEASQELGSTWDRETRAVVRESFARSSHDDAAASFARVDSELVDFTAAWTETYDTACASANEIGAGPLQDVTRCLRDARDEALALGEWMREGNRIVVDGSFLVARSMPDPSRCAQPGRAMLGPTMAQATEQAHEVQRVRTDVVGLELHNAAARWQPVRDALGAEVEASARALDYAPLLARVMLARGRAGMQSNHPQADAQLRAAMKLAANASDHALEAEATALLLRLTTTLRRGDSEALPLLPAAEAAAERAGDPRTVAIVATNAGSALMVSGDVSGAVAKWTGAIETLQTSARARPDDLGDVLRFRGMLVAYSGEREAGLADLRRAETAFVEGLGATHPLTGEQLRLIGDVQLFLQDQATAKLLFERSVAIMDASVGPNSRTAISAVTQIARTVMMQDDNDAARVHLGDALSRCDASDDCDDLLRSTILESLAWTERVEQRYDDATRHYREALEIVERIGDASYRSRVEGALGKTFNEAGDHTSARAQYEHLRQAETAAHGPKHATVVHAGTQLGHAARYEGDCTTARKEYRRSLRLLDDLEDPPSGALAEVMLGLGACELASGDLDAARDSLRSAHKRITPEFQAEIAGQIEFLWARVLELDGERETALSIASSARTRFVSLEPMAHTWLAEVDAWLRTRGVEPGTVEPGTVEKQ